MLEFQHRRAYTEWLVLGAVARAFRRQAPVGQRKMEFTNNKEANSYVKPVYRKGWEVKPVT